MQKIVHITLTILLSALFSSAFADGIKLTKSPMHAIGDEGALKAEVMTNIPLGAAGYMGVLNTADGIKEGGLVRNAAYFNSEITTRFKGRKVNAITTAVYWQGIEEATFWIRRELDGPVLWTKTCRADEFGRIVDPNAEEVIYGEDGSSSIVDYEEPINIPCDLVLDGSPIYVGHDLQLRPDYSGIHAYVCSPAYTPGHWMFSASPETGWQDFTGNGAYIIELTTEPAEGSASGLIDNDASIVDIKSTRAKAGMPATVEFSIANYGRNRIRTIDFEYEIADTKGTFSIDAGMNPMPYGATAGIGFDFIMPNETKRQDITVRIVKVNGMADAFAEGNDITGSVIATGADSEHKRIAVIENFASLYQSDEPYAIRSIEKLQETFGDQLILIDAHYGQNGLPENWWNYDPWHCQDYAAQREGLFKIPYCIVNRSFEGDPYYGSEADFLAGRNGILKVVSDITSQPAEAVVDGTATVSSDCQTIDISTNVTFLVDINDAADYTIGYVVTEDGLTGKQRNIYSGNYECFSWFREMGLPSLPLWWERTFNDVARGASTRYGINGSLSGSAAAGQPVTFSYSLPMPNAYDDIKNLNVVTLLIERSSGEIMAAAKTRVGSDSVIGDGIVTATVSDASASQHYNVLGQRVGNGQAHGIVIVNGRKVLR